MFLIAKIFQFYVLQCSDQKPVCKFVVLDGNLILSYTCTGLSIDLLKMPGGMIFDSLCSNNNIQRILNVSKNLWETT